MNKTNRRNILTKIIAIIIIAAVILFSVAFIFYRYYPFKSQTSSDRPENKYNITQFHSSVDKDGDGIDDQQDILDNAIAYVDTHPKYKSRYYDGGYPNDGYGVCTDVVAFAMKNAGYDLRKLVDEDIKKNPNKYDVEAPDSNIDFRRVKNLIVYFKNNTISLTTNVRDIDQWQGGDIVIFRNHIGIVSDKRNKNGVTYVIHHNSPSQKHYEQDILEKRNDIVGHYRISE